MQKYQNNATTLRGDAIKGASVTVTTLAGDLATLYSDNGTTAQANPIITGRDGEYSFYAADGRYNLSISAPGFVGEQISDFSLADPLTLVGTAAASAGAAAQVILTEFRDIYYGARSSDPTTKPSGAAMAVGDEYFYTGGIPNLLKRWNGSLWQASDISTANLAASGGAGMVGADPALNYVAKTLGAMVFDDAINVMWYLSAAQRADVKARTYTVDCAATIQAVLNLGMSQGRAVYAPGGGYRINAGLSIPASLVFYGDGSKRTNFKLFSNTVTQALAVPVPNNSAFIGGRIYGMGFDCSGGAAVCDGLVITTTLTNSALSQSTFHDLYIINVRDGVRIDGVIYMTYFGGITVSGSVARYGWYADSATEFIYNTFENLEVTNVQNGAYAYWLKSIASQFSNLTADGCCYFAGAYTGIRGLSVEGIYADTAPSIYCVQLNQVQSCDNVAIISIPNTKCQYGIDVFGKAVSINGVRIPDMGALMQPDSMFNLHQGDTGHITNCVADRSMVKKLEVNHTNAILNGYVFTACEAITSRNLQYQEGLWTPGYASWTTAPSTITAFYTKVGRMVTISLFANNGICPDFSTITGLPFTANSVVGGVGTMACPVMTKTFTALVGANATALSSIKAQDLTGVYWQLTATYLV
jgi:hypothetical protein